MNSEERDARMTEIYSEVYSLSHQHTQPTAAQVAHATALNAEYRRLERQDHDDQLARIRSAAGGGGGHRYVEAGSQPDVSDGYDADPLADPRSIAAGQTFRNPWQFDTIPQYGRSAHQVTGEYRARAVSAVEKMPGTTDRIRSAATDLIERFDDETGNLSRITLALSEPTYYRAWSKIARNPMGTDLEPEERQAVARVRELSRALSLTDSASGYLVPFQLDPTVIITANGSVNQIRQVARQVIATGDVWNGVSAGAVSWSYDMEATEVSDDSPTFAQPTVPIYKAQGFVPISMEAFQDAANITAEVGRLMAFGKDVLEAQAFAVGTGVGMPTGIVTALTGTASQMSTATADTFALPDVYALEGSLPARYAGMPSTAWLANRLTYNSIRQFDTAGGAGLWANNLREGQPPLLLDRRALISEDMDGVIDAATDNHIAILGDFDNYVIADRIGMTVEFVPHLFQGGATRTMRPTNQRGWLAYVRHGGDSVNDAAFRMLTA